MSDVLREALEDIRGKRGLTMKTVRRIAAEALATDHEDHTNNRVVPQTEMKYEDVGELREAALELVNCWPASQHISMRMAECFVRLEAALSEDRPQESGSDAR